MKEEDEKKIVNTCVEVGHGRAKLLDFGHLVWSSQARSCHYRHGPAKVLAFLGSIFFRFLESCSDNYLQNNLQQKTYKKRLNACVASHEALV